MSCTNRKYTRPTARWRALSRIDCPQGGERSIYQQWKLWVWFGPSEQNNRSILSIFRIYYTLLPRIDRHAENTECSATIYIYTCDKTIQKKSRRCIATRYCSWLILTVTDMMSTGDLGIYVDLSHHIAVVDVQKLITEFPKYEQLFVKYKQIHEKKSKRFSLPRA
jgi:hypothetical protein